jgi:hypothetical protein
MISKREAMFLTGAFLMFLGVVMFAVSNFSYPVKYSDWTVDSNPVIVNAPNSWNITRYFLEGDLMRLEITPALTWSKNLQPEEEDIPAPYQPVFVNITDPNGEQSEILCYFILTDPKAALYLYKIDVTEAHGLEYIHYEVGIGGKNPSIVATALKSGNYTAYISGGLVSDPPFEMKFYIGVKASYLKYPFNYLLFPAVIIFLSGFILLLRLRLQRKLVRKRKI